MMPPRPATPPLPPRDGDFARVRRHALVRRLRLPALSVAGTALAVAALGAAVTPHDTSSIEPATTSTPSPSPAGGPTYSAEPTPDATATAGHTATPSPQPPASRPASDHTLPPASATPSPSPADPCGYPHAGDDVTGTVVDRDGKPVPGASVMGRGCTVDGGVVAVTDAQGRFRFDCHGGWTVVAPFAWYSAERSTPADVGFSWIGGSMYHDITCGSDYHVVLPRAATLHARLVDGSGNPAPGTGHDPVALFQAEDTTTPFAGLHWADDGTLSFTGLAPGRYVLAERGHPSKYFDVTEGQTLDLDVAWGSSTPSPTNSPYVVP
jgi:hypothetical protein